MGPLTGFHYRRVVDRSVWVVVSMSHSWSQSVYYSARTVNTAQRMQATLTMKTELFWLRGRRVW